MIVVSQLLPCTSTQKQRACARSRALENTRVELGTSANFVSVRPEGRIVVVGGIFERTNAAPFGQPAVFQFLGGDSTRIRPLRERRAIEHFHAGYGHYFLTANAHEIASLD
jgi:hypothetical protein